MVNVSEPETTHAQLRQGLETAKFVRTGMSLGRRQLEKDCCLPRVTHKASPSVHNQGCQECYWAHASGNWGPHISFDSFTGLWVMPKDERKSRSSSVLDCNKGYVKLALSAWRWTLPGQTFHQIQNKCASCEAVAGKPLAQRADIPYAAEPSSRGDRELIP
ncbi:hypothetical protein BJY00DRAFT_106433 [Aspergillus carlsbadensis]|nr:hypothetical protein BJY00DRAFT_106433 [Aspergillus carlsbadensis]